MYFFYFDESGSRDPSPGTAEQPKDHLYVLLAVGMFERKWHGFERAISHLKLELIHFLRRSGKGEFNLADCEVKSNWIRSGRARAKESPFLEALPTQDLERLNATYLGIVEYPFFTRSELSNGVQLADLLAYNVYRAFKDENLQYPYFDMQLPCFYRRRQGAVLDGLKVWPEPSPLIAMARQAWDLKKSSEARDKGRDDVGLG